MQPQRMGERVGVAGKGERDININLSRQERRNNYLYFRNQQLHEDRSL